MIKLKVFLYYIVFFVVMTTLASSCNSVNVENYKGDGVIHAVGIFPTSYGYKIDFGKFDLRNNYKENRVLQGYPKIDEQYIVGIYIESRSNALDSDLDFHLSIKMSTFEGNILFDCNGDANSWRWSRSRGENKGMYNYFIYYMTNEYESSFQLSDIPADNSMLDLHVDYVPLELQSNVNEVLTGSVQLHVGGYK